MGQHPDRNSIHEAAAQVAARTGPASGGGDSCGCAKPRAPDCLHALPPGLDEEGIDVALEIMGIGLFEYDARSGLQAFSERCRRIWGFAPEETPTPEAILARIHPEDRHVVKVVADSLSPTGPGRFCLEHRIVLPGGATRWVLLAGRTDFEGAAGGEVRGHGTMRDITEYKFAQQQLYERTSQLRIFVESAPVPLAIFDREFRYVAVSDCYARDWGCVRAEVVGRRLQEVFPHVPAHWPEVQRRALSGAAERCDCELWTQPDGRHEWLRWEMRPWYDGSGQIGGLMLFSEIITQRIQAQEQLRASRARLELAVHAASLGVYEYDFTTRKMNWDARLRRLFGFDPEEVISYEMMLAAVHPEDRQRLDASVKSLEINGGNGESRFKSEFRIINRLDGAVRWIASTGRVHREDTLRIVGVAQDITDRKLTELALEQSAKELRLADERKNVYLATLSHALRSPLAPLRTAAHLLASPKLSQEQLQWVSQMIRRQTRHMTTVLEDVLEITRMCCGKLEIRKKVVSLEGIVQSALKPVRPLLADKRHHLQVVLPESLILQADPQRLSQVLTSLLDNAAKYTDPGGQIVLSAALEGEEVLIRVRDNGMGIAADALSGLFTMFWQTDSPIERLQGGLGVGLAFAQGLVQLHGGRIEARSEGPGCGSEFIVHLPRGQILPPVADAATRSSGRTGLTRARILVATPDEETNGRLLNLLTRATHEVRIAGSGREVLRQAREFRPDVALLDLSLPDLDSRVATLLRQEPWARGLRLIALTAWGRPESLGRVSEADFDAKLLKPVDPQRLQNLLDNRGGRAHSATARGNGDRQPVEPV